MGGVGKAAPQWVSTEAKGRSSRAVIVRLGVGLGIVAFLAWKVDLSEIAAALAGVDPFWLAIAFVVQLMAKAIWAWRWSVLLAIFEIPASFWRLVKGIYVGLFFSNFLPTNVGGDLLRAHWILDAKNLYPRSLFAVFVERFIGIVSLGYVAMLPFVVLVTQGLRLGENSAWILLVLIGLCAGIVVFHPAAYSFVDERLLGRLQFFSGVRRKIAEALDAWHAAGRGKLHVFLLSLAVQLAGILFFYSTGRGLHLEMRSWHYFVIVPLAVVAALLPVSINGLGVREGALVMLTRALGTGVNPAEAVAWGLLSSVVSLLVSLPGGVFYVAGRRSDASAMAEEVPSR